MFAKLKLTHRILFIAFVGAVGMAAIAASGFLGLKTALRDVDQMYQGRVVPLRIIKEIADLYAISIVDLSHQARNGNVSYAAADKQVSEALARIEILWRDYKNQADAPAELSLIADTEKNRAAAVPVIARLQNILRNQDEAALTDFTIHDMYPAIDPLAAAFAKLIDIQLDLARDIHTDLSETAHTSTQIDLGVLALAIVAMCVLAFFIARGIFRELGGEPRTVAHEVKTIADGDFSHAIHLPGGASQSMLGAVELLRAALAQSLSAISDNAHTLLSSAQRMAERASTTLTALDAQTTATTSIAAAMTQIGENAGQIADNAQAASQNSEAAGQTLDGGAQMVETSVAKIDAI
ncbi:MAG: methyl-accepting chemotaxis protein, partial [Zoogloeaceae bacterium]|nr:methyl-accepting chemotaxis protein [Zoogloeaceae bacterium]